MNRTKIEWVKNPDGTQGFTWNPITGCRHNCPYCYAAQIAKRFGDTFPKGFEPDFHPHRLSDPLRRKKPATIFVCSMADLFGAWVPFEWIEAVRVSGVPVFVKNNWPFRRINIDGPEPHEFPEAADGRA